MQGSTTAGGPAAVAGAGPERELGGVDVAAAVGGRCWQFLHPLLGQLDAGMDVRLIRTLAATVTALVRHRNRPLALLLRELGAYLAGPTHTPAGPTHTPAGPTHTPAGTKRPANLIHSPRWQAQAIEDWLLDQGRSQVAAEAARVPEGRALCILDGSVLEKPERSAPAPRGWPPSGRARPAG